MHRAADSDPIQAAAAWMAYITAYGALVEGNPVAAGDHVLLLAASGGVGLAAIDVAKPDRRDPDRHDPPADKEQRLLDAPAPRT